MLRSTLFLLAAALPCVASAQTTPNDPATPPESFSETLPQPTTPAATTAVRVDPDRITVQGFATYDTDGVEGLSSQEFGNWVSQLFANAGQPAPAPDYLAAAFAQSDVDSDGAVGQGEFAAFLKGA